MDWDSRYTRLYTLLLVGVGKFQLKSGTANDPTPLTGKKYLQSITTSDLLGNQHQSCQVLSLN